MKILFIAYDNGSYIHYFPLGLGYLASVLRDIGHIIEIYSQDKYHYPESHLTKHLDQRYYDIVAIGTIAGYYPYRKLLKISEAINESRNRNKFFYIIGGHGPSPEPEYFLRKTKSDFIVIGEGEKTIVELIGCIEKENLINKFPNSNLINILHNKLQNIDGIAYIDKNKNNRLIKTKHRELIKDIDSIPYPAWDLFPIDYYSLLREPNCTNIDRTFPVLSGRGCTFRCDFCYRMDKGFRPRSAESIIDEIKILKQKYGITYIDFVDELFMSSIKRTKELCQKFIDTNLDIKWCCEGRLNYAIPEVLKLMKKAGCIFINYGIESMDDTVLKNMNKNLTTKQIINGVENTIAEKISPGLNMMWGNIGDNEETLQKNVDFLLKYDDHSQLRTIRPVTPYPGCDLYYYSIKIGKMKDVEDFYENKHINSDLLSINFTDIPDEEFHRLLFEANKKLIENYYNYKKDETIKTADKLYFGKYVNFRGFRTT